MEFHTVKVCYVVVISVQVFPYLFRRKINIQQTSVQQYVFMFIVMSHVVLCTSYIHKKNEQHVHCVKKCLSLTGLKHIQIKRTCVTRNINNILSGKVLHSRDKKLAFNFTRVSILGTHNCGKEFSDAFKPRGNSHDVLCFRGYADPVVSSFVHQTQSSYYGGNMYLSI